MSDRVRILHRTGRVGVETASSPPIDGGGVPAVEGDLISVTGGSRLVGAVPVEGAKNSALKLMAAALLAPGRTVIDNVPRITDIAIMADVLRGLGCEVTVTAAGAELTGVRATGSPRASTVTIDVPAAPGCRPDVDLVRRLRASICVLGPLLARCGQVRVAHPGGDAIGSRGLDMHVAGLARMGADITGENGLVVASAPRGLHGATICLDFPSVGATENLVMAAVLADGITEIDNAAREPEIVDICAMLTAMGAQIDGAGTATLRIEGVAELQPVRHATIGDRIVGGTWAFAAAMTRGDVTVHGVDPAFLEVALDKVATAGASVEATGDGFRVRMDRRPRAVDVVTLPFPGFATDLLPMAIGLAAVSEGASLVTENIFDGRFGFVDELLRLGADIKTDGHHAVVRGRERLVGARVTATDIRAGAGLVIAGLCADGVTEIAEVHHIDRGYPNYVADLRALGVQVQRYGD
ncbi:UDP-N-acetylglucosamine 1-carboxyvinyltransferase [Solwaraspora sp. WMMD791]|uniref:UDP-N-acetylglucosamine 1-carboxyvinyltransferase n=1 Tax=Solwaraspora sp. WMMD791 TaxID=3016086 RepID=UPI00249B6743|nr:UDP-N-acetylglucosamine 1-carboxyvinyltransferase [Solwaraspora sp. WMMD791]WFE30226.1 UDP-N-acetylglucosamine 1-carboxyvinyltransferase [Solwaraspora sp. WMMD791]